jgi:hypothetical protein
MLGRLHYPAEPRRPRIMTPRLVRVPKCHYFTPSPWYGESGKIQKRLFPDARKEGAVASLGKLLPPTTGHAAPAVANEIFRNSFQHFSFQLSSSCKVRLSFQTSQLQPLK